MRLSFRKFFALIIAAPIFVALTWFFGIYMQPQGSTGAGFAAGLIGISALLSLWIYAWLVRPGPLVRFRNRGVDGVDRDWGMGLMGASQNNQGKRRRDDDFDDHGGRRSADDLDDDGGDMDEGGLA